MSDRIVLHDMVFQGRHGVTAAEQAGDQPFHVDVEMILNLQPAGVEDDLGRTVDYGAVFEVARTVVESTSFRLIEALAEALAHEVLRAFAPIVEVGIRVRKPEAPIDGTLAWAGVEIWRQRSGR
ncbi:MAG: dihydroneopterin aldolase [Candidatus Limnocylindrales bacterium]